MEKILKIEEGSFNLGEYSDYVGYIISTDQQVIKFGIGAYQACCEDWGYFSSEDDFKDFIGADLLEIETVSTALNVEAFKTEAVDIDSCMFVNFKTSKGLLQFAVYNEHNGYYGHEVKLISNQLTLDDAL